MADRPFSQPLPADLPEDWTSGQIVAPAGADVGLSQQHGYNYLMEQVNATQRAANAINESFDTISGKRTCRVTVGTSAAGWTQADCDYLCDGTDDQEEIQAALDSTASDGFEVVLLDGSYHISAPIRIKTGVTLSGSGTARYRSINSNPTKLLLESGAFSDGSSAAVTCGGSMRDLSIDNNSDDSEATGALVDVNGSNVYIQGVSFFPGGSWKGPCISALSSGEVFISGCLFATLRTENILTASGLSSLAFNFNSANLGNLRVIGPQSGVNATKTYIIGNLFDAVDLVLDSVGLGSIVSNNKLRSLELLNSIGDDRVSRAVVIEGNSFPSVLSATPCITLGANTMYNFVTGNNFTNPTYGTQGAVVDNGAGNIVRFNSNDEDEGSGGGGTAGVSSFNGRSGVVMPLSGDYTADMVGARPDTWTPAAADVGAIPSGAVRSIQALTQEEYDALGTKDAATLYLIKE